METTHPLPLHLSQVQQPRTTINRLHTLFHLTSLLALLYYRFTSLPQQYLNGFLPLFLWLLISSAELLHSFLWVLGQATRWRPLSRTVYPERLPQDQYLPPIDVFVVTADPVKEPTLGVMNTVISAMCLDYPTEKLSVYLSDDGSAPITLYGMKEACKFAKKWIPYCKKYEIKVRAPDAYFTSVDREDEKRCLNREFVIDRKEIESSYQEYKQRLEKARDNGDTNSSSGQDHHPVIEVIGDNVIDGEEKQPSMPLLIYVSRGKRQSQPHHFKAGALNVLLRVSGIISNAPYILFLDCDMYCNDPTTARQAMCFHMDPKISPSLAFVQFPHLFHNVNKNDIYNDLPNIAFKLQWLGMDGVQGPFLSGSCLYLKREALFRSPTQKDLGLIANTKYVGSSTEFISSLQDKKVKSYSNGNLSRESLDEARLLASCTYEQQTQWGEQIGFRYHTVVEDYFTGLFVHSQGWNSVYYYSTEPAFLGSIVTNLNDALIQSTRWNSGLLESLSGLPILCYATIPQLSLLHDIPLYPNTRDPWFTIFFLVYISWHFQHVFEVHLTGGSLKLWWNHLRIFMIKSVTSYFIACLEILMKVFGAKEIKFVPTNKAVDDEQVQRYEMGVFDFRATTRLILPLTTIVCLNIASFLFGIRRTFIRTTGYDMFGQTFLSLFVVVLNYPIVEGMIIRKDNGRVPIHVRILSGAFSAILFAYVLYKP
ncbi:hypothetical protein ACHQM5_014399 [Ranunculus cassubicifolius]